MEIISPVFSVAEFVEYINLTFKNQKFVIRGEFSEIHERPPYGYFLKFKDPKTGEHAIDCIAWTSTVRKFRNLLEEGFEVAITGTPQLHKKGGFRFIIEKVDPIGEGALKRAFEALKKKLTEKGYFELSRKRVIPSFIQKIGLITSAHGEALHDFQKNLGLYGFKIYFCDARVEGDDSEKSIVDAVHFLNMTYPSLQVIALIRGGGSMESLKAFNSEAVAEAIVGSRIPVLTAIGHERDETIAGLISDRNFSVSGTLAKFLGESYEQLDNLVTLKTEKILNIVEYLFLYEKGHLKSKSDDLGRGLERVFEKFNEYVRILKENGVRYLENLTYAIREVGHIESHLFSLNPEEILKKGYVIVYNKDHLLLKDISQFSIGEEISLHLTKGEVISEVKRINT